jgi:type VI secretion system protein ImpA
MPLRNDLLNPISPDNPGGTYIRNEEIWDKLKEARREDDDAPQGDWKRDRKQADWPLTIKLASELLATKSKDLQLAAWLAEAMLRTEGITGLHAVLDLTRGLIENFWDGLIPEVEDGDLDFRAAPLRWVGEKLTMPVKRLPLTAGKIDYVRYRESRSVPTEADAGESSERRDRRQEMLKDGKLAPELFEKDFEKTSKKFYVDLEAEFQSTQESLSKLSAICDERFGEEATPSFSDLRNVLEEVWLTVRSLAIRKRELEPDAPAPGDEAAQPEPETLEAAVETPAVATAAPAAAAPARARAAALNTYDDAVAQIVAAAKFMRQQDPYNVAPYLALRGLRWGELRSGGATIDPAKLGAPPSDLRQSLKRLALEGKWDQVLESAETAMGMECGRGWLDLQRYVVRACNESGYYFEAIRNAVIAELRVLLADYAQLPEMTMMDDTPTANAETLAWIKESVTPPPVVQPAAPPPPQPEVVVARKAEPKPEEPEQAPDPFELAFKAARSGRAHEGIEMLMREMMQEPSGRGRFQRKIQVAQLCLATGNEAIALPILQQVVEEIEKRKLEDWETRELVAHPLAMLYRCMPKNDGAAGDRQKLYAWICRLDPLAALEMGK